MHTVLYCKVFRNELPKGMYTTKEKLTVSTILVFKGSNLSKISLQVLLKAVYIQKELLMS